MRSVLTLEDGLTLPRIFVGHRAQYGGGSTSPSCIKLNSASCKFHQNRSAHLSNRRRATSPMWQGSFALYAV
ncbi:hypothetical protein M378DRAFT_163812 [Amanita muscaria Koide BX008]|uniref:Uncharacterized protein n=1 Tax=Amanita muscaria (strain Koide BX008) TaxID=946122 RepID=A0A0C2TAY3_AMAMK|nr:hypothetical protein M378DRAFT_163812 [Amanita muscaria Koide BX008]